MLKASDILHRASIILLDEANIRWPLAELADWLNEGVRAILLAKPSASTETRTVPLKAGTKQVLPTGGEKEPLSLINVIRNMTANGDAGRMIMPVDRIMLNATDPYWHSPRKLRKEVMSFVYDENVPTEFYVYPANDGTGHVEIALCVLPKAVKAAGDQFDLSSYQQDVGLPEPYSVPLLDYVVFRAQTKDTTGADAGRANAHYTMFAQAVGIKAQTEAISSPNARRSA